VSQQSPFKPHPSGGWRERLFIIVFHHDTRAGLAFDIALIIAIVASVLVTLFDSVAFVDDRLRAYFYALEWMFTLVFTAEYGLRLAIVERPRRYARSFFGVIDLLAILPTYLSLLLPGSQYLLVVRLLRILRIFRLLKLTRYISESGTMVRALNRSRRKILVFLMFMLVLITIFGSLMYLIEGPENGFTSIPMSMYWAVVTVATVGFGDIAPGTPLGRFVTSVLILIGYGIIAVPTGIYTAELAQGLREERDNKRCVDCNLLGHEPDAQFCRRCGASLSETPARASGKLGA
jgi:voltage-gated potassium channel